MVTAQDEFKNILKRVERTLPAEGVKRVRHTYYIHRESNVGLIELQKSMRSTRDELFFTVNVGAYSARIASFARRSANADHLAISDCHWRERIGFIISENEDKWWSVKSCSDVERVVEEVCSAVTSAMPPLLKYLEDENLRDLWLNGRSPGLTETARLLYLSVLLREIGPSDRLPDVIAELRQRSQGKPHEAMVERHVEKLQIELDGQTAAW